MLTSSTNLSYSVFLTISFFTTSFKLLKSTRVVFNLTRSNLSNLLFKLPKLIGTFYSLSISNLPTSDFKLVKSAFLAKLMNQNQLRFLSLVLFHNETNPIKFLFIYLFFCYGYVVLENNSFYITISFLSIQLLKELL